MDDVTQFTERQTSPGSPSGDAGGSSSESPVFFGPGPRRWLVCCDCLHTFQIRRIAVGRVECPRCSAGVWTGREGPGQVGAGVRKVRKLLGGHGEYWDGWALVVPLPFGYFGSRR